MAVGRERKPFIEWKSALAVTPLFGGYWAVTMLVREATQTGNWQ